MSSKESKKSKNAEKKRDEEEEVKIKKPNEEKVVDEKSEIPNEEKKKKRKIKEEEKAEKKAEDEPKEKKKNDQEKVEDLEHEVHTANNWEQADLANENEKIEKDLEKQFTEGLNNKLTHAGHIGLGFAGPTFSRPPAKNTHKTFDEDDPKEAASKPAATPQPTSSSSALSEAKAKYKKMNFVKSSS